MPEATPEFKQRLREAFDEMHVGQAFAFRRTFTSGDVALFCGVTGDYNPYHQDEAFAKESWYGRLTIPGLLTGSMLTHIGGLLGFLATDMSFEYLAPVFVGDTITCTVPFMAEYFTGTGHYGYQCLDTRYGSKDFAEDDQLNRYLNCLRLQDIFLKNLFDQYKELGLYDNTIFVLFGDHGEGLGEHGRYMHGDTIWEEGLRMPLIIHAPGWFEEGERVEGLSSQMDILPTVLEMLGYEVKGGQYPGYSLLHPLPEDRTLMFSCISGHTCLAGIKGDEKYIYHFDNQPEEVFNLSKDPLEERNLAVLYSEEALDKRREELFKWRAKVNANYGPILLEGTLYSESSSP